MKISFMGGQTAGIIGLLTVLSLGHRVVCAIGYDKEIGDIIHTLKIPRFKMINDRQFKQMTEKADILLCVHGKELLSDEHLILPSEGCYNIHPYLYKYKGKDPIGIAMSEDNTRASVGMHEMTENIDNGKVICELYKNIIISDYEGIYSQLYPLYVKTIIEGLKRLENIINKERENW